MITTSDLFLGVSVFVALVVVVHNHFFAFPHAMRRAMEAAREDNDRRRAHAGK